MKTLTTTKRSGSGIDAMRNRVEFIRDWLASDGQDTAEEARTGAQSAAKEVWHARAKAGSAAKDAWHARARAGSAVKGARKAMRKRITRARVAAARARASRPQVGSKKAIAAAGAAGAAGAFFLDPHEGRRRRHLLKDRAQAMARKGAAIVRRQTHYRVGQAEGKVEALKSKARRETQSANDQDLADRVKSETFRAADAPKGSVSVNVEHGIVYLRGHVDKPKESEELANHARKVDGVRGVENLLNR